MKQTRNVPPEVAKKRAETAAAARWGRPGSREAASEATKQAQREQWEDRVDPDRVLPANVRAQLGEEAMRAHMRTLSLAGRVAKARAQAALAVEAELRAEAEVTSATVDDDDGDAA